MYVPHNNSITVQHIGFRFSPAESITTLILYLMILIFVKFFYCLLNKITVIHRHILRLFYLLLLPFGGFSIFFFIFLAPSKTGTLLKMIPPPPSAESKTSSPSPPSTSDKKDSKVDESKSMATTSKVPVKAA